MSSCSTSRVLITRQVLQRFWMDTHENEMVALPYELKPLFRVQTWNGYGTKP